MKIYNEFIINPDTFRIPQYNISPFSTEWINKNHALQQTPISLSSKRIAEQLWGEHYYTTNGKNAIAEVLKQYSLSDDDEVFISTTTGNTYISSCVTKEIEKFCKWNRKLSNRTKLIFINHEFGTTHSNIEELINTGLPLIEDRAMSMLSTDQNRKTGKYGDFTIYSLPKFFPMQTGGVIQVNNAEAIRLPFSKDEQVEKYIERLLPHFLEKIDSMSAQRWKNYILFSQLLEPLGFKPELNLNADLDVPSVYMFHAEHIDLSGLKIFMQANGVESSAFYGRSAFFMPVHQYLTPVDINFITSLIQFYCNEIK